MRRALILLLLLVGMQLIVPLGRNVPSSGALLTFGFLILAAYTVGEIMGALRLPKLLGYLIAGIVFGPSAVGAVTSGAILRLQPVSELAVALIAFLAGAELRWSDVKDRGPAYLRIIGAEMPLNYVLIATAMYFLYPYMPGVQPQSHLHALVFALLFASIAIAHSPAVTLGILAETHARGPVARTALGVVLVSDVFLVIVFSLVATLSRALLPPPGTAEMATLTTVVWEIAGALVMGALLGAGVALYLRFVHKELLLFGIIVALLGTEIARLAHVELLLTLLTAGFVTENFAPHGTGEAMRKAVERSAAPVFVVFFALSGAGIHVDRLVALIAIAGPIALLRAGAIFAGTRIGARWAGVSDVEQRYVWMSLISQAGVAIGLATAVASVYPELGVTVQALALALIPINELVGPVLFKRALALSGELPPPSPHEHASTLDHRETSPQSLPL
jgi:Kef-type K+ transport system membrane component KefB